MQRMTIRLVGLVACILGVAGAWAQSGSGSTRYDFERVEVEYAALFVVEPVNVEPGDWAERVAGGPNRSLTVTFGVVRFWTNGSHEPGKEEFVRVAGLNGSRRFLLNSLHAQHDPNSSTAQSIRSFFWSAKQLENNSVVKDFTRPIHSLELLRQFDAKGDLVSMRLATSNEGESHNSAFWQGFPDANNWQAVMSGLRQTGLVHAMGGEVG